MKWYERLLPTRLRKRAELSAEDRAKKWLSVGDNDPCLLAVIDVLDDLIEGNASTSGDVKEPVEIRLQACNRMQIARQVLQTIEYERAHSREMVERERSQKQ